MINIYKRLNSAIDYIEQHIFEEPDMRKICRLLELSGNLASPLFELLTGFTIKDYIRKRRLSEAALLLAKDRVIDVAVACGYETREGFSRAFKAFHGISPSNCPSGFNYLSKIHFDEQLLSHSPSHLEIITLSSRKLYSQSCTFPAKTFNEELSFLLSKLKIKNEEIFIFSQIIEDEAHCIIASEACFEGFNSEKILCGGKYIISKSQQDSLLSSAQPQTIQLRKNGEIKYLYLIA